MPFSGIPGSPSAIPGSIVPGYAAAFGYPPFEYIVHVLSSKSIRVKYQKKVILEEALLAARYIISNVTVGAYVPVIESVRQYEEDLQQFEIRLLEPLTHAAIYSLEIFGVPALDLIGGAVSAAHNFVATVPDGALPVTAILNVESHICVQFDRDVRPFSLAPTANIKGDGDPSNVVALSCVSSTSPIQDNCLLFSVPVGSFSASSWLLEFTNVVDVAGNSASGNIPVKFPDQLPQPRTQSSISSIRLLSGIVTNYSYDYANPLNSYSNLRLFFNTPVDQASASSTLNYTITDGDSNLLAITTITSVDPSSNIFTSGADSSKYVPLTEYGWYIDVRVLNPSFDDSFYVSCSLTSENGLSSTVMGDEIFITPLLSAHQSTSSICVPENQLEIIIRSDVSSGTSVLDQEGQQYPPILLSSSLEAVSWALYNAWVAFDNHRLLQSHTTLDSVNVLTISDLPDASLDSLIASANSLASRFGSHRSGSIYHGGTFLNRDAGVPDYSAYNIIEATDQTSLIRLVRTLCTAIDVHTQNPFLHSGQSQKWRTAPVNDSVVISRPNMLNDSTLSLFTSASVQSYDGSQDEFEYRTNDYSSSLLLKSSLPYPAAVVPILAIRDDESSLFLTDIIECYISKRMERSSITGVTITPVIPLSGFTWASETKFVANVNDMQSVPYVLSVTGLKDLAGNQVP